MPEQKILITIDNEGAIVAKTHGYKGESCLEALDELLAIEGKVCSFKKTEEYDRKQEVRSLSRQTIGQKI